VFYRKRLYRYDVPMRIARKKDVNCVELDDVTTYLSERLTGNNINLCFEM